MQILKKILLGSFVFCALAANASAQKPPKSGSGKPSKTATKVETKVEADKFSQALGTAIAENLKANGLKPTTSGCVLKQHQRLACNLDGF